MIRIVWLMDRITNLIWELKGKGKPWMIITRDFYCSFSSFYLSVFWFGGTILYIFKWFLISSLLILSKQDPIENNLLLYLRVILDKHFWLLLLLFSWIQFSKGIHSPHKHLFFGQNLAQNFIKLVKLIERKKTWLDVSTCNVFH